MLGKLMRHEIRATWTPMALICAALLAVSGLARLFVWILNTLVKNETVSGIFTLLFTGLYMLLFAASIIVVFILIALRFYNHLYSAEGYLTLMIPAPRWQLVFTKLIVSVMWCVIGSAAAAASIAIIISGTDAWYTFGDAVSFYSEVIGELLGGEGVFAAVIGVVSVIVSYFESVLMIFCAISIGQLFKKYRVLGAILGYFGISTVMQTVTSIITVIFAIIQTVLVESPGAYSGKVELITFTSQASSVVMLLFSIIATVVMYAVTNHIIKRAVNLQ